MTDSTAPKAKRGSGPLTATACADRIATALGELPARIETAKAETEAELRAALRSHVAKLIERVPTGEREKVGKVLLALGCELSGFELQPTNDTATEPTEPGQGSDDFPPEPSAPDDGIPERLKAEVPAATGRIVVDRSERKTGAQRT